MLRTDDRVNTNQILLSKLISNILPNIDKNYHEYLMKYHSRMLNAQINLSCFTNESTLINFMENQITKIYPNNSYNYIEKLHNKLSLLSTKKTVFNRKWAILFLLLKLSNDTNEYFLNDSAKTLHNLFVADEEDNNIFLNSQTKIYKNQPLNFDELNSNNNISSFKKKDENFSDQKNLRSTQNNIVVIESKSNKKITEFDLVNDLIFVFQGIDGHYINFNNLENAFTLNSLIPWKESVIDITHYLCELGWLYKQVSDSLNNYRQSNIQSQFIQSFYNAIQNEFSEYYK
jgi:hypothetical protein